VHAVFGPIEDVDLERLGLVGSHNEVVRVALHQLRQRIGHFYGASARHFEVIDAVETVPVAGDRLTRPHATAVGLLPEHVDGLHKVDLGNQILSLFLLLKDGLDDENDQIRSHAHQHIRRSIKPGKDAQLLREVLQF